MTELSLYYFQLWLVRIAQISANDSQLDLLYI
jgi:hypothetical protein